MNKKIPAAYCHSLSLTASSLFLSLPPSLPGSEEVWTCVTARQEVMRSSLPSTAERSCSMCPPNCPSQRAIHNRLARITTPNHPHPQSITSTQLQWLPLTLCSLLLTATEEETHRQRHRCYCLPGGPHPFSV